jgi:two-component system, OmpR family, response regulator
MTSEQPDANAASDGAVLRSLGPDASRHTGPRVLVVDDDANIRQMLLDALDDAGFVTREAQHGAEAMSVVQDWHPDVILLDLVMPWMNGYEFADAYRQAPGPHAPIIVVTAAGRDAVRSASSVGAEQVVPKPFQVDHLLNLVGYYGRYRGI